MQERRGWKGMWEGGVQVGGLAVWGDLAAACGLRGLRVLSDVLTPHTEAQMARACNEHGVLNSASTQRASATRAYPQWQCTRSRRRGVSESDSLTRHSGRDRLAAVAARPSQDRLRA